MGWYERVRVGGGGGMSMGAHRRAAIIPTAPPPALTATPAHNLHHPHLHGPNTPGDDDNACCHHTPPRAELLDPFTCKMSTQFCSISPIYVPNLQIYIYSFAIILIKIILYKY